MKSNETHEQQYDIVLTISESNLLFYYLCIYASRHPTTSAQTHFKSMYMV